MAVVIARTRKVCYKTHVVTRVRGSNNDPFRMNFFTDMFKHVLKATLYLLLLLLLLLLFVNIIIVFSFFDLKNAQYNFLDAL